jgi:hypothetical protein
MHPVRSVTFDVWSTRISGTPCQESGRYDRESKDRDIAHESSLYLPLLKALKHHQSPLRECSAMAEQHPEFDIEKSWVMNDNGFQHFGADSDACCAIPKNRCAPT